MSPHSSRSSVLDLEILEADIAPTFIIKIGVEAIAFEILFGNESFRKGSYQEAIVVANRPALLFRSWTQALSSKKTHEFGGCLWTGEIAGKHGKWKIMRAADLEPKEQAPDDCVEIRNDAPIDQAQIKIPSQRSRPLSTTIEIITSMLEMTDVGIFEISPNGRLIYANDAWFKLSGHAKDLETDLNGDLSFMDCVHPEDEVLAMSKWNTLVQGRPISFEMRWKPNKTIADAAQWILASGCPVLNEKGETVTISGITLDISGQKKSEEAAVARVEALKLATLSERKFARFAELSPIAIYIAAPDQCMQICFQYVNDQFFELTGHPRVPFEQLSWDQIVTEEDMVKIKNACCAITGGKTAKPVELKLKKTWIDQEGNRSEIWVEGSSYPEMDENGTVISIMGTLFDISHFKWAESMQRRRIEEALEAKRQAENFIDSTSHELRNPLSAVIQCADSVVSSLQQLIPERLTSILPELVKVNEVISTCIDYTQIIISCSLHQQRLINDILTMSKLDSSLILITPIPVQPAVVVSDALRMFDVECSRMRISLEFREDETLKGFEWVMLDPSRLIQILINLIINAIKFTKDRPVRKITVTLGASWSRPPSALSSFTFTNTNVPKDDVFNSSEWGKGREIFLWLKVQDTGRGMNSEEQKRLFAKFSQASPKTHVKYGGSGLGLFISKSLSTLQGGSIGVLSAPNAGSTFAFFVGSRISHTPANSPLGPGSRVRSRTQLIDEGIMATCLNILIVEDNIINQKVLSKELQKAGCNVSVAGNGEEALEWLRRSVYWRGEPEENASAAPKHELDLILMDIEMPVMNGLTCSRIIREYERHGLLLPPQHKATFPDSPTSQSTVSETTSSTVSVIPSFIDFELPTSQSASQGQRLRIPILAVSANARGKQIQQALAAGMDDAISKPFRIKELRPKMEALVNKSRERCEI
ncbi:hypothetical protein K505DRAFT_385801 [Melanomma pulvis-pyrius CBS 109.77]|uniref:Uncharacterized protein n=1 Tax=Melanomma pulvis-pyrius CBS 109.77 TaxID=1314802 RepID=A0A6A6XAX3_9PLEO|nr:hypothetical protein K505DRAFT_385801 [Melanomma pulvis-pyrius CBS 109.77]